MKAKFCCAFDGIRKIKRRIMSCWN